MTKATPDPSGLDDVIAADHQLNLARMELQQAVDRARAQDLTWAQIGEALGFTRQAAFKRFGNPRDPRTGQPTTPAPETTAVEKKTEEVFSLIDAGDYETLASMMAKGIAEVLTRDAVLNTWAHVVADTGNLIACRNTSVELPDGSAVIDNERVRGSLIGRTFLECEAGQWAAQVVFDPDSNITGILITAPGITRQ
ncbi:hypothetical protein FQ377_14010 [Arthrobacter echini]|uniref:DUF3887 domain-containing protein n=1 Tax=Arthrobacter echini TaxID=1529066 RepID=A0A5D0XK93_9MICC|nr:hypothetical protein [Arthrobacter echini]TYC96301.1 hypothetical protein FQ377_14010 [Arthrobacter echini]